VLTVSASALTGKNWLQNCCLKWAQDWMGKMLVSASWRKRFSDYLAARPSLKKARVHVTNFIQLYLHQFSIDSHGLNGYGKPLKRPFDWYQSCLEAINNGRDIRQINW